MAHQPRILLLDIETAPNVAYVWGLFDQNIAHGQLEESSYVLCWSAKWLGDEALDFASCQSRKNYVPMLKKIHGLLSEADIVVHYYGSKFDIPVLNKEFVKCGIMPPSPYKQIDLKLVAARAFKFESNKLDYIAESLGFGKKIKTDFQLWVDCMKGHATAWKNMEAYNRHDVRLLEKVYDRLLPWIERHPTYGAYIGGLCCPRCGATKIQKRGEEVTRVATYARYQCQKCAGWFRDNKRVDESGLRGVNIAV
jgi:DNA polymerase elongation subunit (family B)